jgi:alkylation response protein AidB-like acyl-CoA dehydrogenase
MPGLDESDAVTTLITPPLEDCLRRTAETTATAGHPDPDTLAELRASGLLATAVPRRYGGAGGDAAVVNRVVEQIAYLNPSVAIMAFQHFAVSARIAEWGTPAQRDVLLPRLADGSCLAASAWSENGAGAAKRDLRATGRPGSGATWVLNGEKSFTTSASVADLYLVLVGTGPKGDDPGRGYGAAGQTFFLVESDNPGLVPDLSLTLVGMRGSATGFVTLHDCAVTDADRLGPLGEAATIIAGVRESGATLGAVSVGIARAAVDLLTEQLRRRGRGNAPETRDRLVRLRTLVESAHAIVSLAGSRSAPEPGITTLHSKLHASAVAEDVCLEVARMLGSAGFIAGAAVNRMLGDARAVALMGPTNDLCRELVAMSWTD